MKQNRTNNNKYIFLIFLAIYFLSTGGIFTTNQHWILLCFIFHSHVNAFFQEV